MSHLPLDPVHRVLLPRLLLVADGFAAGRPGMEAAEVRDIVRASVEAGVAWVLLRDHGASGEGFEREATRLVDELRSIEPSIIISLGRYADLAHELGTGVHTGREGPSVEAAREKVGLVQPVGYSAHSVEEAAAEARHGADYILLGPVYATKSHPGWPALGTGVLAEAAEAAGHVPVYALGGVTPENAPACRECGAYGVAVLSGILDAPAERVLDYLHAMRPERREAEGEDGGDGGFGIGD
jgi:thiamine-phosphate pyrophosphorylase